MLGRLARRGQCLCRGRRRERCKLFPLKIFPPMALLFPSNLGGVLQLYKSILAIVSVNVPALLGTTSAKSKQRIFGWYFLVEKLFLHCTGSRGFMPYLEGAELLSPRCLLAESPAILQDQNFPHHIWSCLAWHAT